MKPVISSETFQKSLKVSLHEHPGDPCIESEPLPAKRIRLRVEMFERRNCVLICNEVILANIFAIYLLMGK